MFKIFLLIVTCLISFNLPAEDLRWNVKEFGTLPDFKDAAIVEFNEYGQALISGHKTNEKYSDGRITRGVAKYKTCSWAFWQNDFGLVPINDVFDGTVPYTWSRVNGEGVVIGLAKVNKRILDKTYEVYILMTWKNGKFQNYHIPIERDKKVYKLSKEGFVANCRNSKSVIFTCSYEAPDSDGYDSRILSLVSDRVQDLTPQIRNTAASLGYNAGNFLAIAVNSQNDILGRFNHYQHNPYKNQLAPVSMEYFIWDGKEMTIIPNASELLEWFIDSQDDANHISFDAEGSVLFSTFVKSRRSWESWIWTKEEGTKLIGGGHIKTLGITDNGTILWCVTGSHNSDGFIFQKKDERFDGFGFSEHFQYHLLPLDRNRQPLPVILGEFQSLKIDASLIYGTWPLQNGIIFNANGNNQFFITGKIFGERHPFVIEFRGDN
ncbi:MAG TPA: hypothetical protein VL443_29875 [Cyclobacteriaceae bacterium]|jgi:hypothetical protein|nr:hypothetical protein [Cyclobacteriaceae bacterium]